MASGNGGAGVAHGPAAVRLHPVHRVRRTEMNEPAIRRQQEERMPDVDVAGLAGDQIPVYAGQPAPSARGIPAFRGARTAAAAHRPNPAAGQSDTGIVPARIVHVRSPRPGVVSPIEQARAHGGAPPPVHQDTPIGQRDQRAAEHIMRGVIVFDKLAGGRIPGGRIRELRAGRESRALVGCEGQHSTIGQCRRGNRNVRSPRDHGAPIAERDPIHRCRGLRDPPGGRRKERRRFRREGVCLHMRVEVSACDGRQTC